MIRDERPVILHQGIYKKTATVSEAVFMITGMTIGAGILGLPYAVAQVGLTFGLVAILTIGIIMLAMNLMIGEVVVRATEHLQLPGLAGKYLGRGAKGIMSVVIIFSTYGVLLAYLIGEGESLAALFGGSPITWAVIFWSVGSFFIWGGLQRITKIERILSASVIALIVFLSLYLLPHFEARHLTTFYSANVFFPLGVILFALHASPAIAEARELVPDSGKRFKKALLIGTIIPIVVYLFFTLAVVGMNGQSVTEVATVGIGEQFGPVILVLANLFAIMAMSTAFMGLGTALKETLVWDHKVPLLAAKFLVISLPLALYLLGLKSFVAILDVVGGLFISIEGIIMALVYLSARKRGDVVPEPGVSLAHPLVAVIPVILFFSALMIHSLYMLVGRLTKVW